MAFYTALSTLITHAANFIIMHYDGIPSKCKNNMKKIQFTEFAQYLMKIDK